MRLVHRVRIDAGGDTAAPGGAVTTALCGHWEHDGPCRWPHATRALERGGALVLDISVECDAAEADEVRRLVLDALAAGETTGPDGWRTTWELVGL
jgi:hypothetical protein